MFEDPDNSIPSELKIKQLAITASRLVMILDDTWATYLTLFELLDIDEASGASPISAAIEELEVEISAILKTVRDHLNMVKLFDEPVPTDKVEDFESSVLSTLSKLDDVDLDKYRVEAGK